MLISGILLILLWFFLRVSGTFSDLRFSLLILPDIMLGEQVSNINVSESFTILIDNRLIYLLVNCTPPLISWFPDFHLLIPGLLRGVSMCTMSCCCLFVHLLRCSFVFNCLSFTFLSKLGCKWLTHTLGILCIIASARSVTGFKCNFVL